MTGCFRIRKMLSVIKNLLRMGLARNAFVARHYSMTLTLTLTLIKAPNVFIARHKCITMTQAQMHYTDHDTDTDIEDVHSQT